MGWSGLETRLLSCPVFPGINSSDPPCSEIPVVWDRAIVLMVKQPACNTPITKHNKIHDSKCIIKIIFLLSKEKVWPELALVCRTHKPAFSCSVFHNNTDNHLCTCFP